MFSLIITIISIALVAAIAVATLYYGGTQFSQGTAKATADQIISAAQQIAGANTLYANNLGGGAYDVAGTLGGISDLKAQGFLNAIPSVASTVATSSFTLTGGTALNTVQLSLTSTSSAVCAAIEKQAGSLTGSGTTPNSSQNTNVQYDCWTPSAGTYTFQFKG
jgi:hypothetical protein